ncbi:hypothetical protein FB451DRAFT_1182284 [Mycena latifolia]|nr:hypothetical protein FB451DRAFT_1182284 [Mycena latifolia]
MSSISDLLSVRPAYLQETFLELYINGKESIPIPEQFLTSAAPGLYTGLFFLTLHAMIFKRAMHKHNLGIFLSLIAMYILSTVHVACRWLLVKNAFTVHGDTAESAALYLVDPPLWLTVLSAVMLTVNPLVADCVLIWRCWIIWNRRWVIVVIPILCTLAGAGLGFRSIAEQAAYVLNPNLDRDSFIDFATPYFSLSLVTTCLATVLIIFRIITMTEPATRRSRGYGRVVEIIVESALLYSVTLIIFLPLLVTASADDGYAQAVLAQMTGVGPTLIVARVTFGFARPDETWQARDTSGAVGDSWRARLPSTNIALSRVHPVNSSSNAISMKPEMNVL